MEICFEDVFPVTVGELFAFHADPANLAVLMRSQPEFRLLHHDGGIEPGCTTWIVDSVGWIVPVVLGFRHTVYQPPHRFGEELCHGPYLRFRHLHEFESRGDGTLLRDRLDVRLPWYYGGTAAMQTLIAPRIRRAFAARHAALRELLGTAIPAPTARAS